MVIKIKRPRTRDVIDSKSQEVARKIMGENFFGINDAMKYFGFDPMMRDKYALREIPFSTDTLLSCCDTHVLMVATPACLDLDLQEPIMKILEKTADKCPSWKLIKKNVKENTLGKNFDDQCGFLNYEEKIPSLKDIIHLAVGHYKKTGKFLFQHRGFIVCWTEHSDCSHFGFKVDENGEMTIVIVNDLIENPSIGVASEIMVC